MQRNVASQKWIVFAFDETDNTPKTGDANQITAEISKDGAAGGGNITDTNPTELEDGYYAFDITAGESNADLLLILPESTTPNIQVIGVPGSVYTTEPNRNKLSVDSNGRTDVIKVAGTTQSANDNSADINAILEDTGTTLEDRQVTIAVDVAGLDGNAMVGTDSALLAASVTIADGAIKSDLTHIHGTALTETTGQLAAGFKKLFDVTTPLLVASDVMVGTDSAALASVLGAAVGVSISADIAAVKAETVLIVEDTNEIQGKLPATKFMGSSDGADDDGTLNTIAGDVANIDGIVPAAVADLGTVQSGDSYAIVNGVAGLVAINSDVEAILNDTGTGGVLVSATAITAIWAKAMSDIAQGAPSSTASVLTAINYLYEAWRNKTTTTATLITVMKDDGSTGLVKSTISDDATTFTKGEMVSGA